MRGRAIYRLPFSKECVTVAGEVRKLDPSMVLKKIKGFFIEPFISNNEECTIYIDAEEVATYGCCEVPDLDGFEVPSYAGFVDKDLTREEFDYHFGCFKKCIAEGQLEKGVMVRNMNETTEEALDPINLFKKACELYPRMMIALFSTPVSGTWLVCTPEILVERVSKNIYHTKAIAGSKPLTELETEWPARVVKDIEDVKNHIVKTLESFSYNVKVEGPKTVRAAHLLHLKYDIVFELVFPRADGVIIRTLHPSPCVCGIPRDVAYQIIIDLNAANRQNRHYSGGCMGPRNIGNDTTIHVMLHCMQIHSMHEHTLYDCLSIYENSDADHKWNEMITKLDSMLNLINACK